jgi:putative transcriptional regulator
MRTKLKTRELKLYLTKKNKSQNWLAYRLEISSGYMSQLMEGLRHPSPKLRERIMQKLPELTFDDLFVIIGDESN